MRLIRFGFFAMMAIGSLCLPLVYAIGWKQGYGEGRGQTDRLHDRLVALYSEYNANR